MNINPFQNVEKLAWEVKHSSFSFTNLIYKLQMLYKQKLYKKDPIANNCPSVPDSATVKQLARKCFEIKNKINWDICLESCEFVVFDTETTGFFPQKGDEIISIAAVKVQNGKINTDKTFNRLVNPKKKIPQEVIELTGISNEMVSKEPVLGSVLSDFLDFIDNKVLVAHHAAFDLAFLNLKLNWYCNSKIYNPVIDTLGLARAIHPEIATHNLDYLAQNFNIECINRHTALGDSLITAKLLLIFLESIKKDNIDSLKHLNYFINAKNSLYYCR